MTWQRVSELRNTGKHWHGFRPSYSVEWTVNFLGGLSLNCEQFLSELEVCDVRLSRSLGPKVITVDIGAVASLAQAWGIDSAQNRLSSFSSMSRPPSIILLNYPVFDASNSHSRPCRTRSLAPFKTTSYPSRHLRGTLSAHQDAPMAKCNTTDSLLSSPLYCCPKVPRSPCFVLLYLRLPLSPRRLLACLA